MRKRKKLLAAGCVWMLFLILVSGMFLQAASDYSQRTWVWDGAGLLTEEEVESLNDTCIEIAEKHDVGISIITVDNFGGGDIKAWQKDVYERYDLGAGDADSGLMLAISMAERDWGLVAFGDAQNTFTTYSREKIAELFLPDLSNGNYYDSFSTYLKLCDEFLTEAENGTPYSAEHTYKESVPIPLIVGIAFVISFGISLAVVLFWKKSMNTRVKQNAAGQYYKEETFSLTRCTDQFLYHTVSRHRRPQNNSSGGGSGGMHSTSSGTSGKF